jgi:PAS domain S-box-containing protein
MGVRNLKGFWHPAKWFKQMTGTSRLTKGNKKMGNRYASLNDYSNPPKNEYSATQAHLEAILNTAHDAIIATDAEQRVMLFNVAAQMMFGYSLDEVIGKHLEILIPVRSRLNHRNLVETYNAAANNRSRSMGNWRQIHGLRADGSEFPIMASISRVADGHNKPLMIVSIRDKTHEMEIEKSLRKSIETESRMLEQHLSFTANITHELRTPLNAIIGFAELLMAHPEFFQDETKTLDYIKIIHQAGESLNIKMKQFTKFSEASSGHKEYFRERIDLISLCNGVFKSLEKEADKLKLKVTLSDIVGIPEIINDTSAIRTILFNIIGNAIKFNVPDGKVNVQLITSNDEILVSVTDTGVGIPQDQLEFLGRPFFRSNSAYDTKMSGIGLGLALSTSIAKNIGAQINIQSDWGSGTTVLIRLPMEPDHHQAKDLI